jgi:hypothetical protein
MSENVSEWTPNQQRFIRWLATPSAMRERHTHAEIAEEIGVTERTLYRWKDLPGLTREVSRLSREMLSDELPEIYGALVRSAKSGSFQHIKLALEVSGEHVDKQEIAGAATIRVVYDDGGGT